MVKRRDKQWIVVRDFSVDAQMYRAGDRYVPDRYFERLTRLGCVEEETEPAQPVGEKVEG